MSTNLVIAYISQLMAVVAVTMLLALSPRLLPLPIAFHNPRREAMLSIGVYVLILVLAFAMPLIPNISIAGTYGLVIDKTNPAVRDALLDRMLIDWICLIPIGLVLAFSQEEQRFPSIGWNARDFRPGLQLGLGLGLVALFLSGKFFSLFKTFAPEDLFALVVWLGIGLIEETIFRGYIQPRLSAYWNPRIGWIAAAVMYTVWLIPGLLGAPSPLIQIVLVLARGLVLGWIMQKTGHVLAPALYRGISGWIQYL